MIAAYLPAGVEVILQSENGLLGIGPPPSPDQEDPDLINAGKQPVTTLPGSSFFGSDQAFAMIRGGHMDMSILGAIASLLPWRSRELDHSRKIGKGHGRRNGSRRQRSSRSGRHGTQCERRILQNCRGVLAPLTGKSVVHDIVTELGWFHVSTEGLVMREIAEGITAEDVEKRTGCRVVFSPDLHPMLPS